MTLNDVTILDTGPSLNFFSIGQGNLLIDVLTSVSATLAMPEDVVQEVRDKTADDERFCGSDRVLGWALREGHILQLDSRSGADPLVDRYVSAILGMPFEQRSPRAKDLGEMMVIAHARARMDRGERVLALIDDGGGQNLAGKRQVRFITTLHVLRKAAQLGFIADWAQMRAIYLRLRPEPGSRQAPKDRGLLPLEHPEVERALHDKRIFQHDQDAA